MTRRQVAVIVTTYNRPNALSWTLAGLAAQTVLPELVIVADDGSRPDTKYLVESTGSSWIEKGLTTKLVHLWQPDCGFRAAQVRNKAVAYCLTMQDYRPDMLVFIDGDCIPRTNFIARHKRLLGFKPQPICIAGGRLLLNQSATEKLERLGADVGPEVFRETTSIRNLIKFRGRGHLNRIFPLFPLPGRTWRRLFSHNWRRLRTCNMSIWTEYFLRVDGFDEEYVGWGLEDSDLAIRLIRSGVHICNGRFATNVLHLWHQEADRSLLAQNRELFSNSWKSSLRPERGLSQHLG